MSELEVTDADDTVPYPVSVDAFNATQRGEVYGDAPAMTAALFARHVERNAIDLSRSPRWTLGGSLAGVALLGFRGRRTWLGGFGVVPELRGRGLARRYLDDAISICRDAGAETLELEVLVRNAPAIALYERGGFAVVDELVVWSRAPLGTDATQSATAVYDEREIARVARTPATCWQRELPTVAAASPCERVVMGDDAAPRAYAFFRRDADRTTILDMGAGDASSAASLLDALDARVPNGRLVLINEPARGFLHEAFSRRSSWTETTRQLRMCRRLTR